MKCPECHKRMTKVSNKWRCTNSDCPVTILKEKDLLLLNFPKIVGHAIAKGLLNSGT